MLTHRLRRLAALVLVAWLAAGLGPAGAHAIVVAATPKVGTRVAGPTVPIELRFNSRIDHERSRLLLIKPDGAEVALPLAGNAPPEVLRATVTGLTPGSYRLRWQVLATDGHITRGDIPFQVGG